MLHGQTEGHPYFMLVGLYVPRRGHELRMINNCCLQKQKFSKIKVKLLDAMLT